MGRTKVPKPIERRHLVERELTAAQALHYAQAYLEQGLELDAVDFLAKAQSTDQLERLRAQAIENGDGFLLRSVAAAMHAPAQPREWHALAEAAERAGKQRYAADARRLSERSES
ncbi:MAG TPA: hypothetical protein VEC18_07760 [Myxococcota bacterium]|nr:hypothetical protein [Myxococcota bacterium]